MEFVYVNAENIKQEHICCAMTDREGEQRKKAWMKEQFKNGLTFYKLHERGKVFIEYLPAEYAWLPIQAEGYMHINCLWVAGKYAGQGIANTLLQQCIQDAKQEGKYGLTILSSKKKRGFLSDPKFLNYKNFRVADTAFSDFILYYLPFDQTSPIPRINECAKSELIDHMGMVVYYHDQCPFTHTYVDMMKHMAKEHQVSLLAHKIESCEDAQNTPCLTSFNFYDDGKFVTNEIFSQKRFLTYIENKIKQGK